MCLKKVSSKSYLNINFFNNNNYKIFNQICKYNNKK